MRSRIIPPQKRIVNQALINELNEFMVRIKVHLFDEIKGMRENRKKPTIKEIDAIHAKLDQILSQEQEPYIKY